MNRSVDEGWRAPVDVSDDVAGFIQRYEPAVRRFFARRLPAGADVDDFTQELFARLFRRVGGERILNDEGYLFRIAANMLLEHARREARHRTDAYDPTDRVFSDCHEERSPERVVLGREACASAIRVLQGLPERTRAVFLLNRYEGLTGREIAKRLDISLSAVEKHMMRAIAQLQASVP